MSTTLTAPKTIEDWLAYVIPISVALAGFNWANLVPGTTNSFFLAVTMGFLAKLLVGLQQNGWKAWEDLIPTVTIGLGFLSTTLTANPDYLAYGTVIGFIVKALGYFSDRTNPLEDLLLAVGAFLTLYGVYKGNATIQDAGALLSLIGKTIPSIGGGLPPVPAPTPAPVPPGA